MIRYFFLVFILFGVTAEAQQIIADETLFKNGISGYRQGQFAESVKSFERVVSDFPASRFQSAARLMLSKTYLHLGMYFKSAKTAEDLIARYPGSRYRIPAHWVIAQAACRSGKFSAALEALSVLRSLSGNPSDQKAADSLITGIARHLMRSDELSGSIDIPGPEIRPVLQFELAKKSAEQMRYRKARNILSGIDQKEASKALRQGIVSVYRNISALPEGPVHVGVIASLTGDDSDMGIPLKEGIELAVQQYNRKHSPKIELHILDNRSEIITSMLRTRELLNSDRIGVLIGPPDGYDMAAVASEAFRYGIPVISPNSSMNRLTELGDHVYQANIDLNGRFQALAEHAVRSMGMKTFAVLAPSDEYGDAAVKSFIRTVQSLGGKVIAVERYYEGTQDFRNQLIRIRKLGMIEEMLRNLTYDKTALWAGRTLDSLYALYYPVGLDDREMYAVPAHAVEGLFLPVYPEDIAYLPPQIAYYNIQAQWLGGDHWNQPQSLKQHQSYIKGLTFTADYLLNAEDDSVMDFMNEYRSAFKRNPVRESVFGYDVMAMIARLAEEGNYDRDDFSKALKSGIEWKGLHNRIVFTGGSKVSSAVHLLQYKDNNIIRIK